MGFLSFPNLVLWFIFRAWIVFDQFPLQLDREVIKERENGEKDGGRGDYSREAIILNISIKGGDYSMEAINLGTAIIRGNRLCRALYLGLEWQVRLQRGEAIIILKTFWCRRNISCTRDRARETTQNKTGSTCNPQEVSAYTLVYDFLVILFSVRYYS